MEADEISHDFVVNTNRPKEFSHYFALYAVSSSNLELQCTDLNQESEKNFKTFIARRLEMCAIRSGEGNLCSLEFQLNDTLDSPICYYAQLIKPITAVLSDSDEGDLDLTQKYVVCFLTSSDVNLEFFRLELQDFCNNAVAFLDLDVGASTNSTLEIQGCSQETKDDILRFISSCGVAEMIGASTESPSEVEGLQGSASLKFGSDGSYTFTGVECDQYCREWAKLMLEGEKDNPMFLKRVMENFKLTTVQSMNTFKRLLTDAETDYYALYRAFIFLKNSKQGTMLLQHAKLHMSGPISDVLNVLETYIPT